jgi:hypothetical protein
MPKCGKTLVPKGAARDDSPMPTTLDMPVNPFRTLPETERTTIGNAVYEGFWAVSGAGWEIVEVDRIAANPINSVDPSGLVTKEEGNEAHRIILSRYKAFHPSAITDPNSTMGMIIKNVLRDLPLGSILSNPISYLFEKRPDIYDPPTHALYEVKPFESLPLAFAEATWYRKLLNLGGVGAKMGPVNHPAVWGISKFFGMERAGGRWLVWFSIMPGTISYTIEKCKPERIPRLAREQAPAPVPATGPEMVFPLEYNPKYRWEPIKGLDYDGVAPGGVPYPGLPGGQGIPMPGGVTVPGGVPEVVF